MINFSCQTDDVCEKNDDFDVRAYEEGFKLNKMMGPNNQTLLYNNFGGKNFSEQSKNSSGNMMSQKQVLSNSTNYYDSC